MKRKPPIFHRPRRLEVEYRRALEDLMARWLDLPAFADLEQLQASLGAMGQRGSMPEAERLFRGMVTAAARGDASSWREAAMQSSQGQRIREMLRRGLAGPTGDQMRTYLHDHARLIQSVPQRVAQEASQYIATRQMRGERAEAIYAALKRKLPDLKASHVEMLARTQVASTTTAITRARAESLDLNWYEWDTSEDARVRPSHRKMDLVLVNWSDPPAPEALIGVRSTLGRYHAGNCPNCRCDANVIVYLDQVRWPHKVYTGGEIRMMTLSKFKTLAGLPRAA